MKRTSLTTAVIAGLAGVAGITNMAGAVNLSSDGTGSVLIYPYYTVNNNNNTLLTVVNTTAEGKAVKVRFLEARNSREVLDFNLYMSPFDVWTASVTASGAGAGVVTNDHSCTVPSFTGGTVVPFRNNAYAGSNADTGPTDLSRTREGYVELIEMGTVTNATNGSLSAITHSGTPGGTPAKCSQVVGAWASGGYWTTNSTIDIGAPDGGLFGTGMIVNVGEGTVAGYSADAIQGFYVGGVAAAQHTAPGSVLPNIASGSSNVAYTFTFNPATGTVQPATTTFTASRDAVSAVFMVDDIYNTYEVDPSTGASTEWVVNFPTKRFYVDPAITAAVIPPFDELFGASIDGASCDPVALSYRDREEATTTVPVDFSPPPTVAGTALCWEAQVVTFNQTGSSSTVLGSTLTANIPLATGFLAGWADIGFDPGKVAVAAGAHQLTGTGSAGNNTFFGLPATGFNVQNYVNANVSQGVLANYSALFTHKYLRKCTNGANACS
jgi:hypothetical protein